MIDVQKKRVMFRECWDQIWGDVQSKLHEIVCQNDTKFVEAGLKYALREQAVQALNTLLECPDFPISAVHVLTYFENDDDQSLLMLVVDPQAVLDRLSLDISTVDA